MINALLNKNKYEYDIHSLIKAFYPETDVKMFVEGEEPYISSESGLHIDIRIVMADEEGYVEVSYIKDESETITKKLKCTKSTAENDKASSTNGSSASLQTPKNALKQALYLVLNKETGKTLPWGTLTGIRPVKIPMTLIEQGKSQDEIKAYMEDVYFCGEEKTELSIDIAAREHALLKDIDLKKGYSIYIGIPFCPTTCMYCSFTSFPIAAWKDRVDDYVTCLEKEIDYVADAFNGRTLDTIYVGGGTPTTLEPYQIERLLSKIEDKLDLSNLKELTVESGRPDSITPEKLRAMKKHNVTRISVNPQTMHDKTLKFIGRRHTVEQSVNAYKMAREEGFDNINMDIILGLPGENLADVEETMRQITFLAPDDLTVHSLAIKRASALQEWINKNGISMINNTDDMMRAAANGAEKMELKPYYLYRQKNMSGNFENTGYAKEGKAGLYNIIMMEEKESVVALGAGSVSKALFDNGRIERCDNIKDITLYMNRIDEMIERKKVLFS